MQGHQPSYGADPGGYGPPGQGYGPPGGAAAQAPQYSAGPVPVQQQQPYDGQQGGAQQQYAQPPYQAAPQQGGAGVPPTGYAGPSAGQPQYGQPQQQQPQYQQQYAPPPQQQQQAPPQQYAAPPAYASGPVAYSVPDGGGGGTYDAANGGGGGQKRRAEDGPDLGSPDAKRLAAGPGMAYGPGGAAAAGPPQPDTVLRLLVPGRRVGPILGRGGQIVKQIKDETGSRIRVVEPPPNCDERVVVISSREDPTAPVGESNAQKGLYQVFEKYLEGDESPPTASAPGMGPGVLARMLVATSQAGIIIGKGGVNIRELRDQCGAHIKVLPPEEVPACGLTHDRVVQMVGNPDSLRRALRLVSEIVRCNPPKERPGGPPLCLQPLLSGAPPMGYGAPPPGYGPPPMGYTPAPGGYAPPAAQYTPPGPSPVGPPAVAAAAPPMQQAGYGAPPAMQQQAPPSYQQSPPPQQYQAAPQQQYQAMPPPQQQGPPPGTYGGGGGGTRNVMVPNEVVGTIIGSGGATINRIRQTSGARIKVHDEPSGAERLIEVSGTEEQIQAAEAMLAPFRDGANTGGSPYYRS